MAMLSYANTAVDMYNLNFNAVFQAGTTFTSQPTATIFTEELYPTVANMVFPLPSHDLNIDTFVQIDGGGLTSLLYGRDFVFDDLGAVIAGEISVLAGPGVGGSGMTLLGAGLRVADYLAVAQTVSNEDDFRLMKHLLRGNDLVFASDQGDAVDMGRGKDLFADFGGSDTIHGGKGDDYLASGDGGDRLYGGSGNDILINFATDAHLHGGAGDDMLQGGWNRDRLHGGAGADCFLFAAGQGHDVVTDFAQGEDRLVMLDFATAMADLTIVQRGDDTRISFGEWSVLLRNVDSATLTDGDFVFGQPHFLYATQIAFFTGWDYIS